MNELVIMRNQDAVTTSLIVAEVFGKRHDHVLQDIKNLIPEITGVKMFDESTYKNSRGREYPMYYMNRDGFTLLVMGYTGKEALRFKLDFIKQYNRMEEYIRRNDTIINIGTQKEEEFKLTMLGVEIAARMLRADDTSKILMLEEAHKIHGIKSALPNYVDDEVTSSMTELLKEYDINMSTIRVNRKLVELGILEEKERPSTSGKKKKFKSLTDKGLTYGKNLINPKSPKETQPHYYDSKFEELMKLVLE